MGENRNGYRILVEKSLEIVCVLVWSRRWEDNIKIDLIKKNCENWGSTEILQVRVQ
jgi:hypothetical protein